MSIVILMETRAVIYWAELFPCISLCPTHAVLGLMTLPILERLTSMMLGHLAFVSHHLLSIIEIIIFKILDVLFGSKDGFYWYLDGFGDCIPR